MEIKTVTEYAQSFDDGSSSKFTLIRFAHGMYETMEKVKLTCKEDNCLSRAEAARLIDDAAQRARKYFLFRESGEIIQTKQAIEWNPVSDGEINLLKKAANMLISNN